MSSVLKTKRHVLPVPGNPHRPVVPRRGGVRSSSLARLTISLPLELNLVPLAFRSPSAFSKFTGAANPPPSRCPAVEAFRRPVTRLRRVAPKECVHVCRVTRSGCGLCCDGCVWGGRKHGLAASRRGISEPNGCDAER